VEITHVIASVGWAKAPLRAMPTAFPQMERLRASLDNIPLGYYTQVAWLTEGRQPETFGGWSKVRRLLAGLVILHSGDPGAPPGGHYEPPARSWLIRMAPMPPEKRGPRIEKSRGGAPIHR
jgi:hypothetical protein